jgi:hypothetical protein
MMYAPISAEICLCGMVQRTGGAGGGGGGNGQDLSLHHTPRRVGFDDEALLGPVRMRRCDAHP